jgi:hypothetical protein
MTQNNIIDGVRVECSQADLDDREARRIVGINNTIRNEAMSEIQRLEQLITNKRLRDSILTADGKTWLDDQEKLIAVERAKL